MLLKKYYKNQITKSDLGKIKIPTLLSTTSPHPECSTLSSSSSISRLVHRLVPCYWSSAYSILFCLVRYTAVLTSRSTSYMPGLVPYVVCDLPCATISKKRMIEIIIILFLFHYKISVQGFVISRVNSEKTIPYLSRGLLQKSANYVDVFPILYAVIFAELSCLCS